MTPEENRLEALKAKRELFRAAYDAVSEKVSAMTREIFEKKICISRSLSSSGYEQSHNYIVDADALNDLIAKRGALIAERDKVGTSSQNLGLLISRCEDYLRSQRPFPAENPGPARMTGYTIASADNR